MPFLRKGFYTLFGDSQVNPSKNVWHVSCLSNVRYQWSKDGIFTFCGTEQRKNVLLTKWHMTLCDTSAHEQPSWPFFLLYVLVAIHKIVFYFLPSYGNNLEKVKKYSFVKMFLQIAIIDFVILLDFMSLICTNKKYLHNF